jgi:hypothetical protein
MPKRLRPTDICLPDRKRPKTMEIQNFFYNLPDDIIDHIFSFIKRPRLNMNYSENALNKIYIFKDY